MKMLGHFGSLLQYFLTPQSCTKNDKRNIAALTLIGMSYENKKIAHL